MSARAIGERRLRAAVPAAPPVVAVAIAAALLAAASVLAALSLVATMSSGPEEPSGVAAAATVRAWIGWLNEAAGMRGGPVDAGADVLAPGFALHQPGRPDLPPARLEALLAEMGRGVDGLRFVADGIVSDGEWAAARLVVTGGERRVAGTAITGARPVLDVAVFFRLEDGRIAEAWAPEFVGWLPRAMPSVRVPLWRSPTPVVLARIVLPPGADVSGLATSGMHLLLPETGVVQVRVAGRALVLRGDGAAGWEVIPPGGAWTALLPGEALLVTDGSFHAVMNRGSVPASMLGFATVPYIAESGEGRMLPKTTPLSGIYGAQQGVVVSLPGGVRSVTLARGLGGGAPEMAGRCTPGQWMMLEVTRAMLQPGESLPTHEVRGVEVLESDQAGALAAVWLAQDGAPARVARDEGLAASDRLAGEVRNDRSAPMALTAIWLTPDAAAPCAPGEEERTAGSAWSAGGEYHGNPQIASRRVSRVVLLVPDRTGPVGARDGGTAG